MEVALLGYLLGLGTVVAVVKEGKRARALVAWSARQAGFISGRVTKALEQASQVARDEYQKARVQQSGAPGDPKVGAADAPDQLPSARFNGN